MVIMVISMSIKMGLAHPSVLLKHATSIVTYPTLFRACMCSVQKLNFVANGACPKDIPYSYK